MMFIVAISSALNAVNSSITWFFTLLCCYFNVDFPIGTNYDRHNDLISENLVIHAYNYCCVEKTLSIPVI